MSSEEMEQASGGESAAPGGEDTLLTADAPENDARGDQADGAKESEQGGAQEGAAAEQAKEKAATAEAYELAAPDGYPMDAQALKAFTEHCREAGLSKQQAEKQLSWMKDNYQNWQKQQTAQRKNWREELRADTDFGGSKYDSSLAEARQALARFDEDGQIRAMLNETGYGDHPAVAKIFARVGRALAEDKAVGKKAAEGKRIPLEDRLYSGWTIK